MDHIIPAQQTGSQTDISHARTAGNEKEARGLFRIAADRLLHVSNWKNYFSPPGTTFILTDRQGHPLDRAAEEGDYFRIDLPAPGPVAGEGYDWVRIECVERMHNDNKDEEQVSIRVRPSSHPQGNKEDIAHFFKDTATSSFMVTRQGKELTASVHGRNEIPNTDADALADKARNAITALGALAGFSDIQWKKLTEGLLK